MTDLASTPSATASDATVRTGAADETNRTPASDATICDALERTLAYSRERDYTGWDYADGMSSRIRRWLPVENRWLNLAFQETAKRAPVNVRPLLLVERRRNFMGAGLFAMANLTAGRLLADRGPNDESDDPDHENDGPDYEAEAERLLDWLVQHRCRGYSGFCGSHQHEIQTLSETDHPGIPSVVSTAAPARALLRAGDLDPVYPAVGRTAADFVLEDLDYREDEGGATIRYLPDDSGAYLTPNAMAIGARLLVDVHAESGAPELLDRAAKILDTVAGLQTDRGGWMYRHPPETSHLSMDNFHNGFIVESLLRYRAVADSARYDDVIERALSFHRETLFESDGAPNWDERSSYPRDVHAASQGILVFSYAGEFERAARIASWALDNLYAGDGRFYFRETRFFTKRITLMRWCQAWMAYALSEYLRRRHEVADASQRAPLSADH